MMRPIWAPVKTCKKCDGQGWLWAHELDEYYGGSGDQSPMTDDTKYQCDDPCHNENEEWYREQIDREPDHGQYRKPR